LVHYPAIVVVSLAENGLIRVCAGVAPEAGWRSGATAIWLLRFAWASQRESDDKHD
jgi:hypothetical protein